MSWAIDLGLHSQGLGWLNLYAANGGNPLADYVAGYKYAVWATRNQARSFLRARKQERGWCGYWDRGSVQRVKVTLRTTPPENGPHKS